MRLLQGRVSFSRLAAAAAVLTEGEFLSSFASASSRTWISWTQSASVCHKQIRCFRHSAAKNMAEEAKKKAAYAAVDNHVQVQRACSRLLYDSVQVFMFAAFVFFVFTVTCQVASISMNVPKAHFMI